MPRVVPYDLTPPQLKKRVDTRTLLLDRAVNTEWTRFTIARDEKWTSYNNPDHFLEWCDVDQNPESVAKRSIHGKKEMLCFFICPEGLVYWDVCGEGETVDSTLICKQVKEMEARITPVTYDKAKSCSWWTTRYRIIQKSPRKSWRTSRWNGYPIHPIPRTCMRFSCISKPGKLVPRTALQEPQVPGISTADLNRDQASRLLEERTPETGKTMENNRENTRKVLRRSQESLNCWYSS